MRKQFTRIDSDIGELPETLRKLSIAVPRVDLVEKAQQILDHGHRPNPNWPQNYRPEAHTRNANNA